MPNEVVAYRAAPVSFDEMWKLAQSVARSGLFGMKTPDQAMTLMAIAQAEGRHPALAARDYHIIQNTPAKKAEAMLRDFLESGGKVEWHGLSDTIADATFAHPAGGSVRITWDQERVKQAGLGSNPMHKKYPRQMLRSRCVSEGVRTVCPTATSGMYVPEEVADFERPAREPIDVTPPKADIETEARAAASKGTAELREYLRNLSDEDYDAIQPLVGSREEPGELRATARKADEAWKQQDDPFGLPPLGDAAPPEAEPVAPSADLLGDPPAENVTVPLARNPSIKDMDYWANQLLAMIEEQPRTSQRTASIKLANEGGLQQLKRVLPDRYDEVQAELARKVP